MTKLIGTSVNISGDKVRLSVPISKVDKERRMVHGFATLDNLDLQGDIVPFQASIRAFETFRGNIREMHDPLKAVGRMVSFRPETYFDPETNKVYRGVFVSVYVSKGAQDTWEKVVDGTLTGFSIGGIVSKVSDAFDQESGSIARIIEDYELAELSIVDNPANQLANVIGIEKGHTTGYLADTTMENVFWCRHDNVVQLSDSKGASCYECSGAMQNIGFVETNDIEKMSIVKGFLDVARNVPVVGDSVDFDNGFGKIESIISKGQVKLSSAESSLEASEQDPVAIIDLLIKNDDTIVPANRRIIKNISSLVKVKEKEVEQVESPETEVTVVEDVIVEKSEGSEPIVDIPEVEAEELEKAVEPVVEESTDISKVLSSIDELKGAFASLTETLAGLPEIIKSFGAQVEKSNEGVTAVAATVESVKEEVATMKAASQEFEKRVGSVEQTTAFRKSADLGEIAQPLPKKADSLWGGRFLDNATNFN